jgi:hypothetical protein
MPHRLGGIFPVRHGTLGAKLVTVVEKECEAEEDDSDSASDAAAASSDAVALE